MRNDSNLEKLLKNYEKKLKEYKKVYGIYIAAKENPTILMPEDAKIRYSDEEGRKRYVEVPMKRLEDHRKAAFKAVENAKAEYINNYGNPEELNRVYKEVMNEEPKTNNKPLTNRDKFKNSLRIVRNSHDKLLVTTDPAERKRLNKLIQENSPILQRLRPMLGVSAVNAVVSELEKEEKTSNRKDRYTYGNVPIDMYATPEEEPVESIDDSDVRIYAPVNSRTTAPIETIVETP